MLAATSTSTSTSTRTPRAEMKQLKQLLADVNQTTDQQEMPALRFARQLGNARRFGGGGFGRLRQRLPFGGGRLPFRGGRLPFRGGRRRFPQQFGFFG
ncbi:GH19061 [Drosophila grimshawi]|uniref:GH19061 n=2 Tax=Drosophila grimshawi TaxID=7222 RepID=B4JIA8_DROGR|nr:GH19061 [Drosophila grimshawi]